MTDAKMDEFYVKGKLAMNEKRYDEMKLFFKQAIENGNASAMNDLAFYYQYTEPNPENTVKYYLMAINAGNVNSCYNLACFYHEQDDEENKINYLNLAAKKGDTRAHFGLGVHYEELGQSGKKTELECAKYKDLSYQHYKQAADLGEAKAHTALVDYYLNEGKPVEAKEEWFKALSRGDRNAMYCMDDKRLNVTSDERSRAFELFQKILFAS